MYGNNVNLALELLSPPDCACHPSLARIVFMYFVRSSGIVSAADRFLRRSEEACGSELSAAGIELNDIHGLRMGYESLYKSSSV